MNLDNPFSDLAFYTRDDEPEPDVDVVEPLLGMPRKRARDGRIEVDGTRPGGVVARFVVLGSWHEVELPADRFDGEPCANLQELEDMVHRDLDDVDGVRPTSLNLRPLKSGHYAPADLRPISEPPPNHVQVVLWLSDRSVAIEFYPVVAYNYPEFGKPMWWSGVPGKYVRMGPLDGSNGWTIEGWTPLPSTLPIGPVSP
jgi:hypothetical protein